MDPEVSKELSKQHASFNICTLFWWIVLTLFLFTQPWLSNWANNKWHDHNAVRSVFVIHQDEDGKNRTLEIKKYKTKYGICTTPLRDMICTDGQNFTELAKKYRPRHPMGCGCGEGILGESLCPRTFYGHTLSDYVSTAPGLGAMLGFSFYPLVGARRLIFRVIAKYQVTGMTAMVLRESMNSFQVNFALWSIASVCVFPLGHALLTVTFLGSFMAYALTLLWILYKNGHIKDDLEQGIIFWGAVVSFVAIVLGAVPRVLLMIDKTFNSPIFDNLNNGGFGSYVFWLGEVIGLSIFFGVYPLVNLVKVYTGSAVPGSGYELVAGVVDSSDSHDPLIQLQQS